MDLRLEVEYSNAGLLTQVDELRSKLEALRPFPEDVEGRVMQKLRLDWNYHSNAIEGNRLNYGETVAFLMEGITAKGKPLKDHLDIRGHNEAINFLLSIVKEPRAISEADIRALHQMILVEPYTVKAQTSDGLPTTKTIKPGEYKASANHVKTGTGEMHYYASPEETPAKMEELMVWHAAAAYNKEVHPIVLAALFHHKFVAIHPFDDGNGRLSRILMNLILMQNDYPPVVIKMDDRQNYYALLSQADAGDNWPFIDYIAERAKSSLQLYLKAIKGGDIEEDDDIDKKITLFKMEAESRIHLTEERSSIIIETLLIDILLNLFEKIVVKIKPLEELFIGANARVTFIYDNSFIHIDEHSETRTLQPGNITALVSFVNEKNGKFSAVVLEIDHRDFKNTNNMFSLKNELKVNFNRFDYKISINNYLIMSKFYGENISLGEEQNIISRFANGLMNSFPGK